MDDLAEQIGCMPSIFNPSNWSVLRQLLTVPVGKNIHVCVCVCFACLSFALLYHQFTLSFGTGWPFIYRLQGHGRWKGAKDALRKAMSQYNVPTGVVSAKL